MTIYISSDLHFSHVNLLKYCPNRRSGRELPELGTVEYSNMVTNMNELIISNWNSIVSPEDETFLLGDIAMGKITEAPSLIRRLNGKKYLIKGNHDKTLVKLIKNNPEYSDLFVWIRDVFEGTFIIDGKKVPIFMSHYPHLAWPWMDAKSGTPVIHFFGHLHGSPHGIQGRCKDIGADTNNLYPYLLETAIKSIWNNPITNHHGE